MELDVNWLAVLVATVAHQALGALWYGLLFRNTWLTAMGMRPEDVEREGPGGEMALGAVASFLSALALALILTFVDEPSVADGVAVGAVAGIGFVTAATFMNGAYEQKKPVLSAMFGAYYTLGLMIAGAIVGAWQ
ncbi:MAG TPA: DUF1761 domain-containing protein [Actinomycetota bacterium]|nr:DUF1761 domain-containing protein [Actinomycetota bacterium]